MKTYVDLTSASQIK